MTLIPSLSNAVCDSDLTCVTIAGQIEYVGIIVSQVIRCSIGTINSSCNAERGHHEPCKPECCPVSALQLIY